MTLRKYSLATLFVAAFMMFAAPAYANIVILVNKSTQRMTVTVDGYVQYVWPISTARAGYNTPNGTYAPQRLEASWFSKEYYNSPMPYSIFFHRGYAIHGSYAIHALGGPASHGCVRLHPSNAATLFGLVRRYGMGVTRIVVTGGGGIRRYRRG
jgi:lipoprotein-anchoring transpeptidase ErfK/SrfK